VNASDVAPAAGSFPDPDRATSRQIAEAIEEPARRGSLLDVLRTQRRDVLESLRLYNRRCNALERELEELDLEQRKAYRRLRELEESIADEEDREGSTGLRRDRTGI